MELTFQTKANLSLLVAILGVSGASIFIKYCESPAITIAFWRLFLVVILLSPLIFSSKILQQFYPVLNWQHMKYFILSGLFLSLHFFSWIQSLQYTSVSASVIVVNSSPVWVIFFSFILFREMIDRYQVLGLFLCILGVIIITLEENQFLFFETFQEGVILALFGAIMVAFYLIIGKRMRSRNAVGNIPYTYFVNLFCTLFLFVFSLLLTEEVWVFPSSDFVWFLLLAIGPSLFGHAMYSYAMKRLSAQVVSLSVLGEAIGASILSFILLSEVLTFNVLIGGLLIGLGIIIALRVET